MDDKVTKATNESENISDDQAKASSKGLDGIMALTSGADELLGLDKASKKFGDLRATRLDELREKASTTKKAGSALGGLKITSAPKMELQSGLGSYENDNAEEEESVVVLQPSNDPGVTAKINMRTKITYAAATLLTWGWFVFCASYIIGASGDISLTPQSLGSLIAGVFAPPAMLWLILANMNRQADVQIYAASLRKELQTLLFPSEENASVINKDVERLCRQAAEVSAASKAVLKSLQRARQGLRVEIRDFSGVSKKAEFHIDRLAESLQDRTTKLESLTQDIEQRTAGIDEKTRAGAEAWDQATLKVFERTAEMESALNKGADMLLSTADKTHEKTIIIEEQLKTNKLHKNEKT